MSAAAIETSTDTKEVKVAMGASKGTTEKLAHALAIVVGGVIALCVAAVLADGVSVIKLKPVHQLPVATNPALKSQGLDHRLDQLLGKTYGVGLHHDQAGYSWTAMGAEDTLKYFEANLGIPVVIAALPTVISTDALKHPVPFLKCDDLQMAGLCACSFGFIAEVVAVLMVIFHSLVLIGVVPANIAKPVGGLVWLTLTAGFLIVILLAIGIYTATWTCDNTFIPSIKLADHFDYNYGFVFAILGYVSALLVFVVTMMFTTTAPAGAPSHNLQAKAMKTVGGVTVGVVVAAVGCVIVAGSNSAFDSAPAPDPGYNPCAGQKRYNGGPGDNYFANTACFQDSITQTLEQAGANVTAGFRGLMNAGDRVPITDSYDKTDLCPVNVHWHLGAEHLSVGQFDENGKGPVDGGSGSGGADYSRRALAGSDVRLGLRCHHYDDTQEMFTKPFNWTHCVNMKVGETYEIHWPHSAAGACGTPYQYQTPFYDGVFCKDGIITVAPLNTYKMIGVQSQVFTVVNSDDPAYYVDNLIDGMIVSGDKGQDIAKYTGSTTGTSRNQEVCSRYTPITWQVDRKCHMISASSFEKLCEDMKGKADDMKDDLYPHGSRPPALATLTANNQQSRK